MKIDQFFALAKEKGISECQLQISKTKSISAAIFHHEIDNYSINDSASIVAAGIYNGKFGTCRTQRLDNEAFEYLTNGIIIAAKLNEKNEVPEIFKGSPKYHKKNVYGKELASTPIETKIALIKKIELDLSAADKRINDVSTVTYAESEAVSEFYNSFGLKLKEKSNRFVLYAGVVAKVGEEIKTNFDMVFGNDLKAINEGEFIHKVADGALKKFGGAPCKAGNYPTVIKNEIFADLLGYFLSAASAEEIQKKSSPLIGKLNAKVASAKVNISERPLDKNVFFTSFDDEGVATYNKDIVKHGVLKTYFYNLETAKKDGVTSTGNGAWSGDKIGVSFRNISVKGSKQSFDEMIAPIQEGVYITDVAGLGTGMDARSGNFSCQAEGFMIENGKLTKPLNLITLSGNLGKMLLSVKGLDNNVKLTIGAMTLPDVYVSKMAIGGK